VVEVPQDWIKRSQDGEGEYFDRLVAAYQAPVYNLCLRMLGNPGEAEDATQESFWRAYRAIRRYNLGRPFGTWLLAIAAHHCIDLLRSRKTAPTSLEALQPQQELLDPSPGPELSAEAAERERALSAAMEKLDPEDRAALMMRYWYDMSYEEMSEALSLSTGAVKSRLHRARRTLADQWSTLPAKADPQRRKPHAAPAF